MSIATRLRLSVIDGPELRCAYCGEWWALTTEHWHRRNFTRCISCCNERAALWHAMRRRDPVVRARDIDKSRRYRKWLRRVAPEVIPAYDRERRAIHREQAAERAKRKVAA